MISVHQPHYLPWIGYFDKIKRSDCFVFLDTVQYKKREFQNRNKIRTPDGSQWLTVPVLTKDHYHQSIADVRINNDTDWARAHWKSIEHNYARAPFFATWRAAFAPVYETTWQSLIDLNISLITALLSTFRITVPVVMESSLGITTTSTRRIIDICKKTGADAYLSGAGGKEYMDEPLFADEGIRLEYQHFEHPVYPQAYSGFVPNMCMLDYLFNCGPTIP